MGNLPDRRYESVKYDLDLFFYTYSDRKKWTLRIEDGYLNMNQVNWDEFIEILEKYCIEKDYHIWSRRDSIDGRARIFEIEDFDQSTLLQKTIK